jgi:hypothetical protein
MKSPDESSDPTPAEFGTPYRAILDHCERHELNFQPLAEDQSVRFCLRGETVIYTCTLRISHHDEVLQIRVELPVVAGTAPTPAQAAEFIARANCGLIIGRFDLDMDRGTIAMVVGHVIGESKLGEELLDDLVTAAIATAERYYPGLMRVAFGGHTPADAIYVCELDSESEGTADETAPTEQAADTDKPAPRRRKSREHRAAKPGPDQKAPDHADDRQAGEGDSAPQSA